MDILKLKKKIHPVLSISLYYLAIGARPDLSEDKQKELIEQRLKEYFKEGTLLSVAILYYGDLTKYKDYRELVIKLRKRYHDGKPMYRNYCIKEEEQLTKICYCNVAEDASTSWNTVLAALGRKTGIIIEVKHDSGI